MKTIKSIVAFLMLVSTLSLQAQNEPKSTLDQVMEKMEPRNIGPAGMSGRVT